jgi:hypothetical protein
MASLLALQLPTLWWPVGEVVGLGSTITLALVVAAQVDI